MRKNEMLHTQYIVTARHLEVLAGATPLPASVHWERPQPSTSSSKTMPQTYVYKLTSDRGGAPSAPPPRAGESALLTLSICKPAIRRTAQPGDRLLGLTSHALAKSDGYPLDSVIYAAVVTAALDAREYYAARSPFLHRPDCIYRFHQINGTIDHGGRTPLHADPAYQARDVGQYPFYRNGRTLLCGDFRYFGAEAVTIPSRLGALRQMSEALGQGHRVFRDRDQEIAELDALFRMLWKRPTRFTSAVVTSETYGHAPRPKKGAGRKKAQHFPAARLHGPFSGCA